MFKVVFWYWWALAALMLVCEMLLPGVVFLFLAIGAAVAGLLLLIVADLSLEIQLVVFAIVSVASAIGLRRYLRGLQPGTASVLNARGEALVGKVFVLDQNNSRYVGLSDAAPGATFTPTVLGTHSTVTLNDMATDGQGKTVNAKLMLKPVQGDK